MTEYFYEELPMTLVVAAEKKIERLLSSEENILAGECKSGAAYVTLNMKNGKVFYVARGRKWNGTKYEYHVQVLDKDLKVLHSNVYEEGNSCGMFTTAVKLLRLGR